MDVWRQLRGAWDNLNQMNRQVWDEFYSNNPNPVDKVTKSSASSASGRGKMAAGLIIHTLIDENLKKPQEEELKKAKANFERMKNQVDHHKNGGQLVHPPSIEM